MARGRRRCAKLFIAHPFLVDCSDRKTSDPANVYESERTGVSFDPFVISLPVSVRSAVSVADGWKCVFFFLRVRCGYFRVTDFRVPIGGCIAEVVGHRTYV